jgi:hypothetical protein
MGTIHEGVTTTKIGPRLRGVSRAQHQGEEEQQRERKPGAACRQGRKETSPLPGFRVRTHPELFLLSHKLWNNDIICREKSPALLKWQTFLLKKIISTHENNQKSTSQDNVPFQRYKDDVAVNKVSLVVA